VGNTIAFVSAMIYDRIVGAIGPFEWSEYLGLAVTAPVLTGARAARSGAAPPSRAGIDERQALKSGASCRQPGEPPSGG
jgi:hypothetical protein